MKKVFALGITVIIVVVILLPTMVISLFGGTRIAKTAQPAKGEDIPIKVYVPEQSRIVEMGLEEYVKGVVAAEMPAEFELEALKAQAVAARTFAVKNMTAFGGSGLADHPGADVSSDYKQNQAWLSVLQLRSRWGENNFERYWNKVSRAVDETRGMIATFGGEPISAVFHSTSGERTASAKEVWGFDYPYLQSVSCTWDKKSPRYTDSKEYGIVELAQRLGDDAGVMTAIQEGNPTVAQILERTDSGRVDKIRMGSKVFSGITIRQKLELRSTNFSVETQGEKIVFKTIGYGHGVGLCQYGADGMAKEGWNFEQILCYYYTGIVLKNVYKSENGK